MSPTPRTALVVGKALAAGARSFSQVVIVYTLSLIIASLVRTRERFMGIGQLLTMPLFFASNAFYPLAMMPLWLQRVARVNPLSYQVDVLRALMIPGGESTFGAGADFAVLIARTALLLTENFSAPASKNPRLGSAGCAPCPPFRASTNGEVRHGCCPRTAVMDPRESPTSAAVATPPADVDHGLPDATVAAPTTVAGHRRWAARLVGLGAGVVAVVFVVRMWPTWFAPAAEPVIKASGRIEGREMTLSAKTIQGRVKRLLADEGEKVHKGQVLAELDAAQLEAQLDAARATAATLDAQVRQAALDVALAVKNAEASIAAAHAALSASKARVVRANAVLVNATAAHERARALFKEGVIARQELDAADMALRTSRADLEAAEKDVVRAEADLALATASADTVGLKRQQQRALEQSRRSAAARVEEARANLAEREIVAPADGTVISRPVEVGDVVTPGAPIFQLVDMSKLYVKVYIPEPDIAKLHLGDTAEVFVDAFPNRGFTARISKISDQAEFTPKNVETAEERLKLVFGVELALANGDGLLKPGMPADSLIRWHHAGTAGGGHESRSGS